MKAIVKATGEVFEVESIAVFADRGDGEVGIELLMAHEVEILQSVTALSTEPDWDQRRYEATLKLLAAMIAEAHPSQITNDYIAGAIHLSDKLIAELKKEK